MSNDLAQLMGLSKLPKFPSISTPTIHRLSKVEEAKTLCNEVPLTEAEALEISSKIRIHRSSESVRKVRYSRVSNIEIIRMNLLYTRGHKVTAIAHDFGISATYCLNLISRYRKANKLPALSKKKRGTVNNGYTNDILTSRRRNGQPSTSNK